MLKVMTIVGTRPEIIRLSRVIDKLDIHCHHSLVHTGQNHDYELNQIFFDDLGIRKPDYFLNAAQDSKSAANTIGNVISKVDEVLSSEAPQAVLILGDTNSSLAAIHQAQKIQFSIWRREIQLRSPCAGRSEQADCRPHRRC